MQLHDWNVAAPSHALLSGHSSDIRGEMQSESDKYTLFIQVADCMLILGNREGRGHKLLPRISYQVLPTAQQ